MEVIKKDLKDIEQELEDIKEAVTKNTESIINNRDQIDKNSGTLEILSTINSGNKRFYSMWIITFTSLLFSIGFNIFLLIKLLCR